MAGRWSDTSFLDALRSQGDPLADRTVAELIESDGVASVNRLFQHMRGNADPLPEEAAAPFAAYFTETRALPEWVDLERVARGEAAYFQHALPVALILLAKSLPEGYSAPTLTRILHISGDLEHHPFRRLLGVLQMVVNVCSRGGFGDHGAAIVTAQKLRLLHAGVRHVADRVLPDYRAEFGAPVNHEDMLATIMGFSYLVIEGLQKLDVGLADDEAEDLYYVWRVFAQMMGIHPTEAPADASYVPASVAEAREFYDCYAGRHFTGPEENPEGVILTRNNLRMMRQMIPRPLRWLGLGIVPRIYSNELMTPEACARVGVEPVAGHSLLKAVLHQIPRWTQRLAGEAPGHSAQVFSRLLFQEMVVLGRHGVVEFIIPDSLEGLHELA